MAAAAAVSSSASFSASLAPRRSKTRPDSKPIHLERVLGLNVSRPSGLAIHPHAVESLVAYPAGGITVLYNHKRNKQTGFLIAATATAPTSATTATTVPVSGASRSAGPDESVRNAPGALSTFAGGKRGGSSVKPVSCVAFSSDGRLLAAGEVRDLRESRNETALDIEVSLATSLALSYGIMRMVPWYLSFSVTSLVCWLWRFLPIPRYLYPLDFRYMLQYMRGVIERLGFIAFS
jgi:hypothetical protein